MGVLCNRQISFQERYNFQSTSTQSRPDIVVETVVNSPKLDIAIKSSYYESDYKDMYYVPNYNFYILMNHKVYELTTRQCLKRSAVLMEVHENKIKGE